MPSSPYFQITALAEGCLLGWVLNCLTVFSVRVREASTVWGYGEDGAVVRFCRLDQLCWRQWL
jgi:hypothetical protein